MKKRRLLKSIFIIMTCSIFIGCGSAPDHYNDTERLAKATDFWTVDDSSQSITDDVYKGNFKLDGYGTIWQYNSDEEFKLTVPYTLKVTQGKAKLVLITPNDEVLTLVEYTKDSIVTLNPSFNIPIEKGLNRIKIVGSEDAQIEIELQISKGTFKELEI